jgi:Chromo (CHRromatin Organisation MOdifier) domain
MGSEAIIDHRPASRGREPSYLFKWVGFYSHENSWLPARQLGNAKDRLATYQSRIVAGQPARARRGRRAITNSMIHYRRPAVKSLATLYCFPTIN